VTEFERRRRIARWVACEIVPYESVVRQWLRRARAAPEDADEVIQEAYCSLMKLDSVDHIDRPDAYFFSICRNLHVRRIKRERIVPFTAIAEIEAIAIDSGPSPEQQAAYRSDYARIMAMLDRLPARCRDIVRLRKCEGWSQKEIATHFDITEKAVEKQVWLGVKAIRQAWSDAGKDAEQQLQAFESGVRLRP
jgi:RNA polymerase sigma-70 factor (ECF subfamily)